MRTMRRRGKDNRLFTKDLLAETVLERLKGVAKLEGSPGETERMTILVMSPLSTGAHDEGDRRHGNEGAGHGVGGGKNHE